MLERSQMSIEAELATNKPVLPEIDHLTVEILETELELL